MTSAERRRRDEIDEIVETVCSKAWDGFLDGLKTFTRRHHRHEEICDECRQVGDVVDAEILAAITDLAERVRNLFLEEVERLDDHHPPIGVSVLRDRSAGLSRPQ